MDFSSYLSDKTAGAFTIFSIGGQVVVSQKQFDPTTGVALPNATFVYNPDDLQQQVTDLQNQINGINALLADFALVKPA